MNAEHQIVVLLLAGERYGLWLSAVERVIRMTWVTPLPDAPDVVLGVVKVRGTLRAVIDLRRRFRLPTRDYTADDRLLLARTERRQLALPVDEVLGVETVHAEDWLDAAQLVPNPGRVAGIVKRPQLTLIHDLEACLSLEEESRLDTACSRARTDTSAAERA